MTTLSLSAHDKSSMNQMEEDKMSSIRSVQHRRACGAMHTKGHNKIHQRGRRDFENH